LTTTNHDKGWSLAVTDQSAALLAFAFESSIEQFESARPLEPIAKSPMSTTALQHTIADLETAAPFEGADLTQELESYRAYQCSSIIWTRRFQRLRLG
jgi:hypothetical protein